MLTVKQTKVPLSLCNQFSFVNILFSSPHCSFVPDTSPQARVKANYVTLSAPVGQADTSYSNTAGPGPQRGNNYTTQSQAPSFHPYRRV